MAVIRSISGLRATLGDGISPQLICDYVAAFCKVVPDGEIIIGRDGRPSGKWIELLVVGTAIACNRKVRIIGIVPTPTVQLEIERTSAAGGIAITASHNPSQWNGLKFLNKDGVFFDEHENKVLWDVLDKKDFTFSDLIQIEDVDIDMKANERHIEKIINLLGIHAISIAKKSYKVVVDAVNASGSVPVPFLLRKLGCHVIELNCKNDGNFTHLPEPLPANLTELAEAVQSNNADLGIAVDPDADRLVLIDENGNPVFEELTITLSVLSALMDSTESQQKIVVNYSTTGMVEKIAQKFGATVLRSAVGEINVVKKMKQVNAFIGGEGSGGVILPSCHYGRDSLVGIALILKLITNENKTISQIIDELPKLHMVKTKLDLNFDFKLLIPKIENKFKDYEFQKEDGIRIVLPDGWLHIRSSNTEPIMRIIAEFESEETSIQMIDEIKALIN